jgi:hypothetical protein
METEDLEMQQVKDRLAKVERQNRWLIGVGLALVLSCGIVLLTAQKPVARTIEAQGFVLKDAAGKVRAELHITDSGPELRMYDSQHNTSALLIQDEKIGPTLALFTEQGSSAVVSLYDNGPRVFLRMGKADANLSVGKDGPNLILKDSEGFNTSIGSEGLVNSKTGEKLQSSAASIHLFDKDGHPLWSAP